MNKFGLRRIFVLLAVLIVGLTLSVNGQIRNTHYRFTLESSDPMYRLEIRGSGAVTYTGEKYVKVQGIKKIILSQTDRKKLKQELTRARVDKMRSTYAGPVCLGLSSEEPTLTLRITYGSRTYTIEHYLGCVQGRGRSESELRRLRRLESCVYRLTDATRWIGTDAERERLFRPTSVREPR